MGCTRIYYYYIVPDLSKGRHLTTASGYIHIPRSHQPLKLTQLLDNPYARLRPSRGVVTLFFTYMHDWLIGDFVRRVEEERRQLERVEKKKNQVDPE